MRGRAWIQTEIEKAPSTLRTQLPSWVISQLHNLGGAETPGPSEQKAQSLGHLIEPRMDRRQEEGDLSLSWAPFPLLCSLGSSACAEEDDNHPIPLTEP